MRVVYFSVFLYNDARGKTTVESDIIYRGYL